MIALPLLLAAAPVSAACPVLPLTAAERRADSALVSRRPEGRVAPDAISQVLGDGGWKAVWGTPKDGERSVYFLRRDGRSPWRVVYGWGGVIPPEERADTIAYIRRKVPAAPVRLVRCVVDSVIAGN